MMIKTVVDANVTKFERHDNPKVVWSGCDFESKMLKVAMETGNPWVGVNCEFFRLRYRSSAKPL